MSVLDTLADATRRVVERLLYWEKAFPLVALWVGPGGRWHVSRYTERWEFAPGNARAAQEKFRQVVNEYVERIEENSDDDAARQN